MSTYYLVRSTLNIYEAVYSTLETAFLSLTSTIVSLFELSSPRILQPYLANLLSCKDNILKHSVFIYYLGTFCSACLGPIGFSRTPQSHSHPARSPSSHSCRLQRCRLHQNAQCMQLQAGLQLLRHGARLVVCLGRSEQSHRRPAQHISLKC